jgi:hypothetical protein
VNHEECERKKVKEEAAMTMLHLTDSDRERIKAGGRTEEVVLKQIGIFKKGVSPVTLNRPCTLGDGIMSVPPEEQETLTSLYDKAVSEGRVLKFVPASGAASRMFRDWHGGHQSGYFDRHETTHDFLRNLPMYAFYRDLREVIAARGENLEILVSEEKCREILDYILTAKGLNYAHLPKALLKFHRYGNLARTSLEEHLVEAALYVRDRRRVCRIHLTVSEEHVALVRQLLSQVQEIYEKMYHVTFDIGISIQLPETDTVAVDMDNRLFHDVHGALVFRPGGHGALLKNLNDIDGDIIFLENIDNVVPDRLKDATVRYKKILGGCLVRIQRSIFRYMDEISQEKISEDQIIAMAAFLKEKLNAVFPEGFHALPVKRKRAWITDRLNRPLRVCGMVKNQGEPGGGPFWVDEKEGMQSVQIVEEVQVDRTSKRQKSIWAQSTHFNPVDLVCGVRDHCGRKFDLGRFVDFGTAIITVKSQRGRDLKALELPGLWNGSMAFWNTVFIEVPVETFNPVKTVHDLLRKQHLPENEL